MLEAIVSMRLPGLRAPESAVNGGQSVPNWRE
jgi:hypothetical protein